MYGNTCINAIVDILLIATRFIFFFFKHFPENNTFMISCKTNFLFAFQRFADKICGGVLPKDTLYKLVGREKNSFNIKIELLKKVLCHF